MSPNTERLYRRAVEGAGLCRSTEPNQVWSYDFVFDARANGQQLKFVSRAILRWLTDAGLDYTLSDPGKPWQNDTDEGFKREIRDECLSMEWIRNRQEAVHTIETLATALKRRPAAFEPGLPHPDRVHDREPSRRQPSQPRLLNDRLILRIQAGQRDSRRTVNGV